MTQLHKAIGDLPVLAICTDACKGLEKVVKNVFPHAEHRECFRHLMQNFIKKFGVMFFRRCILQLEHIELKYFNISSNLLERLVIK